MISMKKSNLNCSCAVTVPGGLSISLIGDQRFRGVVSASFQCPALIKSLNGSGIVPSAGGFGGLLGPATDQA